MNFMATNLKPFCSKRSMILPTSPRWTPSGLTIMKVRSVLAAIAVEIRENNDRSDAIIKQNFNVLLGLLLLLASPALNNDENNDVLNFRTDMILFAEYTGWGGQWTETVYTDRIVCPTITIRIQHCG